MAGIVTIQKLATIIAVVTLVSWPHGQPLLRPALPGRLRARRDRREMDAADPARPHAQPVAPLPGLARLVARLRAQHAVRAPVVAGAAGPDRAAPIRTASAAHGIRAHREGPRAAAGARGAEVLGPEAAVR